MALDVLVAVVLCCVTIGMGYMGVHVTLHPTDEPVVKRRFKLGFWGCAAIAVVLIATQTIRNAQSQAKNAQTQSTMQGELLDLRNRMAHIHIRMEIRAVAVMDAKKAGMADTLAHILASNKIVGFNVFFRNVGITDSKHTAATGDIMVTGSQPDLDAEFLNLERRFKVGWAGDDLGPQQEKFFTAAIPHLSKSEISNISKGKEVILLFGLVKFSDSTGDYQQELCRYLQPPGTSDVWHGCGKHESEIKLPH